MGIRAVTLVELQRRSPRVRIRSVRDGIREERHEIRRMIRTEMG